jgi:hypothetical protein
MPFRATPSGIICVGQLDDPYRRVKPRGLPLETCVNHEATMRLHIPRLPPVVSSALLSSLFLNINHGR